MQLLNLGNPRNIMYCNKEQHKYAKASFKLPNARVTMKGRKIRLTEHVANMQIKIAQSLVLKFCEKKGLEMPSNIIQYENSQSNLKQIMRTIVSDSQQCYKNH